MVIWPIRKYGDPILRKKAIPIFAFDAALQSLAADMIETMQAAKGIGLAANQIGFPHALCVVDVGLITEGAPPQAFANPVVLQEIGKEVSYEEGCLSIPEVTEEVTRKEHIRVRYQDLDGGLHEHEIDHLNGVFFIDRISSLRRKLLNKRLKAIAEDARQELAASKSSKSLAPI